MKRIVVFVEGDGEAAAAPILVRRILTEQEAFDSVYVDSNTFIVRGLGNLAKKDFQVWRKRLAAAQKQTNLGGVLLLLDGDSDLFEGRPFCAATAARRLAEEARSVGAGSTFSVACVFVRQEYESWFVTAIEGYQNMPDGRIVTVPGELPADPENAPRNAKAIIKRATNIGYNPAADQAAFTQQLDFELLRSAENRSFRRLEHAIAEIVQAVRSEKPISSPVSDS